MKRKRPITLAPIAERIDRHTARGKPGYDGQVELGERMIVDAYDTSRKTIATVNVRESAIDHMRSRGRVDETQAAVADRFRKMWELAAIGRQRGIDYDNAGGGGGKISDPLTDALVRAGRDLAQCMQRLGMVRSKILVSIVGEGARIEDVAKDWARAGGIVGGTRAEGYVTGTLIDAIDELAGLWRMEAAPRPREAQFTWWRKGVAVTVNDTIRAENINAASGDTPQRSTEIYIANDGTVIRDEIKPIDRSPMTAHASGNVGSSAPERKRPTTV
jgi:hypothetical protein